MMKQTKNIEVVPYNPDWPKMFEVEASRIKNALGNNFIAIHHIGSTSVPGLSAKPKIDIIAVVKDGIKSIPSLEKAGFDYKGEWNIPFKYGFTKRDAVKVNLHVYESGHPEIEGNLLFRDYLRKNSNVRDEYAALKQNLLTDSTSFEKKDNALFAGYTLRKGSFIRKVLQDAGFDRVRMLKCTDTEEWDAAKHFRQKYFFGKVNIADPYHWTFNHPDHVHFILYQGTEIIGYAHIQLWPEARAAMRIIVIDEPKRNNNFGGQFLALCEKWLKSQSYNSIHAEASPAALAFYKKNGYIEMPFNDPAGDECGPPDIAVGKLL
jgi:GrpB-like predicted nucleotidyltransferase (UPF0157 family)/GNAT superfamily N-acetyltransferase